MRTTIDKAGRVVVPKELRDRVRMAAGEVEIEVDGAGLHIGVPGSDRLGETDGWLLAGPADVDPQMDDEVIRRLRLSDQR